MSDTRKSMFDFSISKKGAEPARPKVQMCEWPGCDQKGTHQAPKSKENTRERRWLCMAHVRAVNENWNYFEGMSDAEVEEHHKSAVYGHRPTWKVGANAWAHGTDGAAKGPLKPPGTGDDAERTVDPHGFFAWRAKQARTEPAESRRQLRPLERKALDTMHLPQAATKQEIKTRFKELDEVSVIVQLGFAQRLVFGKAPPRATALMVQLKHTAAQSVAAARLRTLLAGFDASQPLVVRDVEELNPFYVQSLRLFDVIFGFIFVLIGGIVLFTVGNTMNAAVVERTVEIGTLRAIGLRQGGVRRLFVTEGFLLGLAGAVVGSASAVVIAWIVNHSGLTWLPPGSSERLPLQLRVLGENAAMLATSLALIAIATLSAWWPAWRAARLNVVEALRHA